MTGVLDIQPIGFIESPFETKNGTPRQPQLVSSTTCRLKLSHERLAHPEHALEGLDEFSHVWILFYFHQDASVERLSEPIKSKVTPPKLGGQKCGIFATRTPQRPNAIGLSLIEVDRVEHDVLHLRGADLVDGTPVLDVKPFLPHIDRPRLTTSELEVVEVEAQMPSWLTSSLDAETEDKIQKAISFLTKGRTTIVIAHRLSTILNSNVIYVIDKGKVIGHGKHDDLVKTSETYKNFYEKQIKRS